MSRPAEPNSPSPPLGRGGRGSVWSLPRRVGRRHGRRDPPPVLAWQGGRRAGRQRHGSARGSRAAGGGLDRAVAERDRRTGLRPRGRRGLGGLGGACRGLGACRAAPGAGRALGDAGLAGRALGRGNAGGRRPPFRSPALANATLARARRRGAPGLAVPALAGGGLAFLPWTSLPWTSLPWAGARLARAWLGRPAPRVASRRAGRRATPARRRAG